MIENNKWGNAAKMHCAFSMIDSQANRTALAKLLADFSGCYEMHQSELRSICPQCSTDFV